MHMHSTSKQECIEIISSLKNTKTPLDSLTTFLLKENARILAPVLCTLANKCFKAGIFPDILKVAVITPIWKKGDPLNVKNYRPSVLAKLFEKFIHKRLVSFLDSALILNGCQYGFRKGYSTEKAILSCTEYIYEVLNNRDVSMGIFIDFQRAFDTINHEILLRKMEAYGIRGITLNIFRSFLHNRFQKVKIDNVISSPKHLNIRLPQVSTLPATRFLFTSMTCPISQVIVNPFYMPMIQRFV